MFLSTISLEAIIHTSITIYGTKYEVGMLVVIEKKDFGEAIVGVLRAFAFVEKKALFCCTTYEAVQSKHDYYVVTRKVKDMKIVNQIFLADPHPLQRIGSADRFSFSMLNFVSG